MASKRPADSVPPKEPANGQKAAHEARWMRQWTKLGLAMHETASTAKELVLLRREPAVIKVPSATKGLKSTVAQGPKPKVTKDLKPKVVKKPAGCVSSIPPSKTAPSQRHNCSTTSRPQPRTPAPQKAKILPKAKPKTAKPLPKVTPKVSPKVSSQVSKTLPKKPEILPKKAHKVLPKTSSKPKALDQLTPKRTAVPKNQIQLHSKSQVLLKFDDISLAVHQMSSNMDVHKWRCSVGVASTVHPL
ncbi:hypothetical protein FHETE_7863 [Fusarium heterosporum]|uniref:Uncharacterized protein n=1 Tax=Fusarium heterosporum TaxID=42747 RepID=A0A8H5T3Z2_FUSHE|nr:hypothetical protein FHETE_7863 [Fusarium heterosporum]